MINFANKINPFNHKYARVSNLSFNCKSHHNMIYIPQSGTIYVLDLDRTKQFFSLISQYTSSKITLIMETQDVLLIKARVANHSKCFTSLLQLSIQPIYGIPADHSFEERSSATVDAPSNFPDFSCTNFRSENECETKRWERGTWSHEGGEGIGVSPSTACSRIHACTYQYRPCMTRRLTGHADKNEETLLLHSNRAIFRSKSDT